MVTTCFMSLRPYGVTDVSEACALGDKWSEQTREQRFLARATIFISLLFCK